MKFLCCLKVNSIALEHIASHEKVIKILKEKDKCEKLKDNFRSKNEKYEMMRLSSMKSKS